MVLEMGRDRGKPEWPRCVYREQKNDKRFCTNGYAIEFHGLPFTQEILKPEAGILYSSGVC